MKPTKDPTKLKKNPVDPVDPSNGGRSGSASSDPPPDPSLDPSAAGNPYRTIDPSAPTNPTRQSMGAPTGAAAWFVGKVSNDPAIISTADSLVRERFSALFGRPPAPEEIVPFVEAIRQNMATPDEVLAAMAAYAAACGGIAPADSAWPTTSSDAGRDGIHASFYRSEGRVDEDKGFTYQCDQGDPTMPEVDAASAIAAINGAVTGGGCCGGVHGKGPEPGLTFIWKVTNPEGAEIGGGNGPSFSYTFADPAEPFTSVVRHRIKYTYRQYVLMGR